MLEKLGIWLYVLIFRWLNGVLVKLDENTITSLCISKDPPRALLLSACRWPAIQCRWLAWAGIGCNLAPSFPTWGLLSSISGRGKKSSCLDGAAFAIYRIRGFFRIRSSLFRPWWTIWSFMWIDRSWHLCVALWLFWNLHSYLWLMMIQRSTWSKTHSQFLSLWSSSQFSLFSWVHRRWCWM